jgi:hypothetical protein
MTYLFNILVALSQLGNVLLGGYPDESMSARAWRTGSRGKWPGALTRPLIDFVFWVVTLGRDTQHCKDAYESELLRRQFPEHYRE